MPDRTPQGIISGVRVLVDGNNVMHALRKLGVDAGRAALTRLLGDFSVRTGLPAAVVFDGHAPRGPLAEQLADPRVSVRYGESRPADDVLGELIAAHTAPRRLTVVSSDRAVQRLGRRRRCRIEEAAVFALRLLEPPPPKPGPVEPPAKRHGLSGDQAERWLEEFGLSDGPGAGEKE